MKNNITSNRDYITENINLRQQIINLEVANKDKAETIKSMKQELIEYSELRDRFKVLYEENQKYKQLQEQLGCPLENIMPLLLAYKQRYIYTKNGKEEIVSQVGLTTDDEWCVVTRKGFILAKDYKKTWWQNRVLC